MKKKRSDYETANGKRGTVSHLTVDDLGQGADPLPYEDGKVVYVRVFPSGIGGEVAIEEYDSSGERRLVTIPISECDRRIAARDRDPRWQRYFKKIRPAISAALNLHYERRAFTQLIRETLDELEQTEADLYETNGDRVHASLWSNDLVERLRRLREILADTQTFTRLTQMKGNERLVPIRHLFPLLHKAWQRGKVAYKRSSDKQGRQFKMWKATVKGEIEDELSKYPRFADQRIQPDDFDELLERLTVSKFTEGQIKKYGDRKQTSPAEELALDHAAYLCGVNPYDYSIRRLRDYK